MVRLLFCENFFNAVGDRVMDVSINGQLVLDNFDILGNSGGVKFKPVDRLIPVTMNSAGNIRITFDPALNNAPNVASLEITKL